jgi:hypothetical protein
VSALTAVKGVAPKTVQTLNLLATRRRTMIETLLQKLERLHRIGKEVLQYTLALFSGFLEGLWIKGIRPRPLFPDG